MNNDLTVKTDNLKKLLATHYQKHINNYFGDEKKALKFLSSVISSVQRTPELLNCDGESLINSFMIMAELELMPSGVSGEAYVLPYKGKAQFQLGYQGLVTLFYRAGIKSITAEIVYEKDDFKYINGTILHNPDIFSDDRGKAIGAYVIVVTQQGGIISKVMKASDIMNMGKKFSKSFNTSFTPWKVVNDPELWMWKKTVLKQVAKLVPKNETIFKAISEDNRESNIDERMEKAKLESETLKMGNLLKSQQNYDKDEENKAKDDTAVGDQADKGV